MPAPSLLFLSLSQHIGAPADPVVAAGDTVKKGTLIAKANGPVSANVFSPVCGKVRSVERITDGQKQTQQFIVVENDGGTEEELFPDVSDRSPQSIVERVRLAGIVGLGGAGFPTANKLTPKNPLDTLVINGAECEPYLTCDFRLMLERTDDIYKGIKYLAAALGVKRIVMGIEINKPEAIKAFEKYGDIELYALKKQYPMGSEKHLIYVTTGRKVPVGKMPFDVGCCVQNIKTALATFEAVDLNRPLTDAYITVSGRGIKTPKNLKVALGTPFSDIVAYCGGASEDVVKVIAGGPMMGKALVGLERFAKKTDSGILLLREKETCLKEPSSCISCGRCALKCPMRLMPMYIDAFALAGNYKEAERYGAMNCVECGLCAYVCPAKRALVQSISYAKKMIKEQRAKENANGK